MPTTVYGDAHHYPGVWSVEGWAQRRAKGRIGADMTTTDEGAGGDYVYQNSYFSNGGHEQPSYIAKETHLSMTLVPHAPPPGPAPQRSPSNSPSRQISAVSGAFDWRKASLGSSASMPHLSPIKRHVAGDGGRQFVPMYTPAAQRSLQLDNQYLHDARTETKMHERKREVQLDITRNGEWGTRWGFVGKTCADDTRSRRRADPTFQKPSLVGYNI